MATEESKKFARHVYRIMVVMHWISVVVLASTSGVAIFMSEGTSGYWVAALALAILTLFVSVQDIVILKNVMIYEKNELKKRIFIDTYNWQGLNILLAIICCIPGIAVSAAVGTAYGDNEQNVTDVNGNPNEKYVEYVNKEENRLIAIFLACFSALTLVGMLRSIMWHGEVRSVLGIPEKQNNAASAPAPATAPTPAPTPKPETSAGATGGVKAASKDEIQLLKAQNDLLKEQNRIQNEQLTQMRTLNEQFHTLVSERSRNMVPTPPEYGSLFTVSSHPEVAGVNRHPPPENK